MAKTKTHKLSNSEKAVKHYMLDKLSDDKAKRLLGRNILTASARGSEGWLAIVNNWPKPEAVTLADTWCAENSKAGTGKANGVKLSSEGWEFLCKALGKVEALTSDQRAMLHDAMVKRYTLAQPKNKGGNGVGTIATPGYFAAILGASATQPDDEPADEPNPEDVAAAVEAAKQTPKDAPKVSPKATDRSKAKRTASAGA